MRVLVMAHVHAAHALGIGTPCTAPRRTPCGSVGEYVLATRGSWPASGPSNSRNLAHQGSRQWARAFVVRAPAGVRAFRCIKCTAERLTQEIRKLLGTAAGGH
jgi:hypothetical protein